MTLRIALAQCDAVLGDLAANHQSHLQWIERARAAQADLVVFPELSLTGYLLQDLVQDVARPRDDAVFTELARHAGPTSVIVGGIEEGRDHGQYIASFLLEDGAVAHVHRKLYLASYGVFDEARFVGAGRHVRCAESKLGRFGMLVCEDAWHPSAVSITMLQGADLVVVQVASPVRELRRGELPRNAETWLDTLRTYARLYGTHIVFCNRVGSEDGLVFWGHSCVLGPDGDMLARASLFDEELLVVDVDPERVREARLSNPVLRDEKLDVTIRELQRILDDPEGTA